MPLTIKEIEKMYDDLGDMGALLPEDWSITPQSEIEATHRKLSHDAFKLAEIMIRVSREKVEALSRMRSAKAAEALKVMENMNEVTFVELCANKSERREAIRSYFYEDFGAKIVEAQKEFDLYKGLEMAVKITKEKIKDSVRAFKDHQEINNFALTSGNGRSRRLTNNFDNLV